MRFTQLSAFNAVAVLGSFSRAAEMLSLTQPAVSDHVRKLEETYGVQLFNRLPRGAELTALGRRLFAISERLLEAEGQARDLLARAKTLDEGQLTIGADAAAHVLPHLVRFHEAYPRVALRLVTGNSAELVARLEAFSIDLAVTAQTPNSETVLARQLRQDRLVAVFKADGISKKIKSLTLGQLVDSPLVMRETGSVTRRLLVEELQRRGLVPRVGIEVESREAAREAVAQGLGAAVMSEGELVPDSRLCTVVITDWHAHMEEWLLCLKSRADLRVIRSFLESLPNQGTGVQMT